MVNKVFGVKSITHLIYGLVMLLPFGMVFGRVAYTIANKNAKDSYSDKYVSKITELTSQSEYIEGLNIQFNYYANTNANNYSAYLYFSELSFNPIDYGFTQTAENYDFLQFYPYNSVGYTYLRLHNINTNTAENRQIWGKELKTFTITLAQGINNQANLITTYKAFTFTYVNQSLDNAFEYSLQEFTIDNDIGSINFFDWFNGLFLNQTNSHNLIYLNFANWYMNYALLVSSGYLLFLALLWFVNYIRRILDKSMNHDLGGF